MSRCCEFDHIEHAIICLDMTLALLTKFVYSTVPVDRYTGTILGLLVRYQHQRASSTQTVHHQHTTSAAPVQHQYGTNQLGQVLQCHSPMTAFVMHHITRTGSRQYQRSTCPAQ